MSDVRRMSRDELMSMRWRLKCLARYDNPGTVRTGKEWLDRYLIAAWDHPDFESAPPPAPEGAPR